MLTIRQMTSDDLPDIDQVQRASFTPELWEDMSLFQGILDRYERSSFVAHKDGAVLGYLLTHPTRITRDNFEDGCEELSGDEECLYVHDLCVHPDGRGTGIAKKLLEHLDIFAAKNGFTKLCGIAVQGAERFWLQQKFVSIKPYSYHGEPGVFMIKELEEKRLK